MAEQDMELVKAMREFSKTQQEILKLLRKKEENKESKE